MIIGHIESGTSATTPTLHAYTILVRDGKVVVIVPTFMCSSSTTTADARACMQEFKPVEYFIEPEEKPIECIRPKSDFVRHSGRINRCWNNWHGKWMVWYPEDIIKRNDQYKPLTAKRVSGCPPINRGRHFNRKFS